MSTPRWPELPAPLENQPHGIRWHIVSHHRDNGSVVLVCNETPFCVLKKNAIGWVVPGVAAAYIDRLGATQEAGRQFLGVDSMWTTLVTL